MSSKYSLDKLEKGIEEKLRILEDTDISIEEALELEIELEKEITEYRKLLSKAKLKITKIK